jgi:hypothetical protein
VSNPELDKNAMSVAEKLKAEGREEGREEGLWIGKIQSFEEFLEKPQSPGAVLEAMCAAELEVWHDELRAECERRFKSR